MFSKNKSIRLSNVNLNLKKQTMYVILLPERVLLLGNYILFNKSHYESKGFKYG